MHKWSTLFEKYHRLSGMPTFCLHKSNTGSTLERLHVLPVSEFLNWSLFVWCTPLEVKFLPLCDENFEQYGWCKSWNQERVDCFWCLRKAGFDGPDHSIDDSANNWKEFPYNPLQSFLKYPFPENRTSLFVYFKVKWNQHMNRVNSFTVTGLQDLRTAHVLFQWQVRFLILERLQRISKILGLISFNFGHKNNVSVRCKRWWSVGKRRN